MTELSGCNIRYAQFKTNHGTGYATFALIPNKMEDHNSPTGMSLSYVLGASFCSPEDTFIKKLGRTRAMGRSMSDISKPKKKGGASFTSHKLIPCSISKFVTNEDFQSILNDVFAQAASSEESPHNPAIPNWARRCFKQKRYSLGIKTVFKPKVKKEENNHCLCMVTPCPHVKM